MFTTEGHFYPIKQAYLLKKNHQNLYNNDDSPIYNQDATVYHLNSTLTDIFEDDFETLPPKKYIKSNNNACERKICGNRRFNLPMKIRYFDQLFEMVGLGDNLEHLLERKINSLWYHVKQKKNETFCLYSAMYLYWYCLYK